MSMAFDSLSAEKAVKKWNEMFPAGTPVRYSLVREEVPGCPGTTRGQARVLGDTAVVWVAGVVGWIPLSHVQPEADPRVNRIRTITLELDNWELAGLVTRMGHQGPEGVALAERITQAWDAAGDTERQKPNRRTEP